MRLALLLPFLCVIVSSCASTGERRARAYARDFVQSDARSDAANTADDRCGGDAVLIDGREGYSPDDFQCAEHHPVEACVGDDRGYTLCAAEMAFEQADLELNRQWALTISQVETSSGARGAKRLRNDQRRWVRDSNRECEALAADAPTTQQGRNFTDCMTLLTEKRTAQLKELAGTK